MTTQDKRDIFSLLVTGLIAVGVVIALHTYPSIIFQWLAL